MHELGCWIWSWVRACRVRGWQLRGSPGNLRGRFVANFGCRVDKVTESSCLHLDQLCRGSANQITTSIRVFSDNFDLEQHGDDFLVCGLTSNLEVLADEFKNHFLEKKAEIVSLKPEHQNEMHFLKRRISVDNFGWHVELDQRYVKSLLDAMAMNHCKSMATPGSKGQESSRNVADSSEKLDPQKHREF